MTTTPEPETKSEPEPAWVLDRHPVTIGQWASVMGTDALPEQLRGKDYRVPVTFVTALEADEYARLVGGRLPTDSELTEAFDQRTVERIRPAVWEWTSTADGSSRVHRGGSWSRDSADGLSASYRSRYTPEYRYNYLGLRCARPAVRMTADQLVWQPHTIPNEEPHWPAEDVDPYAIHRAKLRAQGVEATSGCYGERLYHIEGIQSPGYLLYLDPKPEPATLLMDIQLEDEV